MVRRGQSADDLGALREGLRFEWFDGKTLASR